jgi:hypothetical protein
MPGPRSIIHAPMARPNRYFCRQLDLFGCEAAQLSNGPTIALAWSVGIVACGAARASGALRASVKQQPAAQIQF